MSRTVDTERICRVLDFLQPGFRPALFVLLAAAILPFVLLIHYAHPSADDFCYASDLRSGGFWESIKAEYMGWKGRYTTIFFTVLYHKPGGMLLTYEAALLALLAALFAAMYAFVHALTEGALSRSWTLLLTLGLGALYLGTMPKVPATLYWLDGAFQYQVGSIFVLLSLAALLALYRTGSTASAAAACAAIFLAIGATEIAMITLVAVVGVMAFNRIVLHGRERLSWSTVIVVTLGSSALLVLAPGNYVRAQFAPPESQQIWFSFSHAWFYGGHVLADWLTHPLLWLASAAFVPVALRLVYLKGARREAGWSRLAVIAAGLFGLTWSYFFALWWSAATNPPGRMLNMIHLLFLAGWFAGVLEATAVIARRCALVLTDEVFPAPLRAAHLAVAALLCGFLLLHGHAGTAFADLSERAARYDRTMKSRYAAISKAKRDSQNGRPSLVFEGVRDPPRVLMYSDIQLTTEDWRNSCFSRYFGLESVIRQ